MAFVSSLLRTIVSNTSFTAARIDGDVPIHPIYWLLVHDPDFFGRKGSICRPQPGNACEPHQVCRVLNLLASLSRPAVYLVYNLTRMNRRSRRTALYDGVGQGSQVLVGVFGQLLIAKFRFQLSRINRAAHITGRVGHLVATYHFSAQAPKASAPLTRALSRAFFVAGDFPSATIRLASPSRSRASASVLPQRHIGQR